RSDTWRLEVVYRLDALPQISARRELSRNDRDRRRRSSGRPVASQLPSLLPGPGRLALRYLDADGGPGLAGAAAHELSLLRGTRVRGRLARRAPVHAVRGRS